ncbi:MAG: AAA family ATPase [Bacteroidaceae bacterium]|nr:AAA family ATPase [Bacteroidaceae bacterium]
MGIEKTYAYFQELKENHVVSQGWNEYKDLSFLLKENNIEPYLQRITYGQRGGYNAFRNIFKGIKAGDIILAFEGNTLKGITEMPDDFIYYYDDESNNYNNCLFPVNWVEWTDFCKDPSLKGQGGRGVKGIENCNLPEINKYIRSHWEKYKEENHYEIQLQSCNKKLNELKEQLPKKIIESKKTYMKNLVAERMTERINRYVYLLNKNYNLILTGAPGTGKTYLAKSIASQMILGKPSFENLSKEEDDLFNERHAFVQFHPSFDYTDFVEGLLRKKKMEL